MRPRLLFVYLQASSFVREDLRILGEEYEVVPFHFGHDEKLGLPGFAALLIRQLYWLLRELPRADAVYGWFADYHMVLPVLTAQLFQKPVVVSIGGFDAVSLPKLGHGVMTSAWRRPLAQLVLQHADLLLPVSSSLVRSSNTFSDWPQETKHGVTLWTKDADARVRVVSTGYDPARWPMGASQREAIVTTVATIDSERTFRIKGIDLLLAAARKMPDVRFRIVGVVGRPSVIDRYDPPPNVEQVEPVPRAELVQYYQTSSVYAQLSRAEGLPNVLCEAMLCGCVPVGSAVFGIPDGIDDVGFLVDEPDPDQIVQALRRALDADPETRKRARRHIVETFGLNRRRERLLHLLSKITGT